MAHLPADGVGLAREEFIFTNFIKIHPLALVHFKDIKDKNVREKINELTLGYKDKKQYLVDKLAQGIAFIATAFYPHEVVVRLSDFKTNEYATLIGGKDYEPKEENPMIGWRGASRYYSEAYKPGFKLECEAMKKVRETWGLKNVVVMVPFCRTVEEGKKVLETMKEFGLERGKNGLKVHVMCEIPSNVLLAKEFSQIFDGFSIGSNDLTQLTLGVDRDSALVSHIYNENNAAVKKLIREVIAVAHQHKRDVGICGQAPSDYPEFAEFLVQEGIDSISLNPDTIVKTRQRIAAMEKKIGEKGGGGSSVLQKATTKALTVIGIVGLVATLGGYTCQTVGTKQITDEEIKSTIALEVAKAKADVRREFENKKAEEKQTYTEDGFVKFTLQYPATWHVRHLGKMVEFNFSEKPGEAFNFAEGTFGIGLDTKPVYNGRWSEGAPEATTTWNGFDVSVYTVPHASPGKTIKLWHITSKDLRKRKLTLEFAGTVDHFDEIVNSIKDFEIK